MHGGLTTSRQLWLQITFQSTPAMLNASYTRWEASRAAVEHVENLVMSLSLHPIPPHIYKNKHSTGNSLGLSDKTGAFVIAGLTLSWKSKEDDEIVHKTANSLIEAIEEDARKLGAYEPYLYLNYVGASQDPISSYGSKTDKAFRAVKRKFDPHGVFSQGSSAGFKLAA